MLTEWSTDSYGDSAKDMSETEEGMVLTTPSVNVKQINSPEPSEINLKLGQRKIKFPKTQNLSPITVKKDSPSIKSYKIEFAGDLKTNKNTTKISPKA